MLTNKLLGILALCTLGLGACTVSGEEEVTNEESELVQFPADVFAAAASLNYGDTSPVITYTRASKWGVVKWNGTAGDEFVATVKPTAADRLARAYLVEKRDTQYVAILSGTSSVDGLVKAKLEKTQEYFIVFREYSRRNASFTVNLARAGGLPAGCTGTPLLEQDIVDRTPQAQEPGITFPGVYETSVRRCNVATGCTDPRVVNLPAANASFTKNGVKWMLSGVGTIAHDGATGELKGTVSVTADDGRGIAVDVTGAATTGCVSFAGGKRVEIDAITYYDVQATFKATTPPLAPRVAYPATPPATPCDGQEVIPDEEVLARFQRGASNVTLGSASVVEDQQYCHPQTGCRPWQSVPGVAGNVTAAAQVLGRDRLGMVLVNNYWARQTSVVELNDGYFTPAGFDVLRGTAIAAPAQTASISDTHVNVKESMVTAGTVKSRRYLCIPIIAHP